MPSAPTAKLTDTLEVELEETVAGGVELAETLEVEEDE